MVCGFDRRVNRGGRRRRADGATAHRGPLNFDPRELVASAAPFGQLGFTLGGGVR